MAMGLAYYQIQRHKQQQQQPSFFNSIFMSTLNMATKMLLSFTSSYSFNNTTIIINRNNNNLKNKLKQHMRFMLLMFTWFSMWAFRFASDFFPSLSPLAATLKLPAPPFKAQNMYQGSDLQRQRRSYRPAPDDHGGRDDGSLVPYSSYSSPAQNLDLIAHDAFLMEMDGPDAHIHDGQSVQALGRALSHVLALLNELPATSRKYEFAMAMADRILDENTRDGHDELLHVNRVALSTAFETTTSLLYNTLNNAAISNANHQATSSGPWSARLIKKLPLGSYINAYMKGGLSALLPTLQDSVWQLKKRRVLSSPDLGDEFEHVGNDHSVEVVGAEKLAQELMWIISKLRASRAEDEALVQWSHASGLASLSLNANPRVQAFLIKISASLLGDVAEAEYQVPSQVQYRLLVLWLPLFCYASNGLRYPVLSSYERIEVERTMDRMIGTLPAMEQEIVLRNWLQDFAICSSDWPNLRPAYDRWCQSSRQVVS